MAIDGAPVNALDTKAAGTFRARLFLVGGPPDNDGDVMLDPNEGRRVRVSLHEHDTLRDPALEPAGEGVLQQEGNAVVLVGRTFDTPRGQHLRAHLAAKGQQSEWSVGYVVGDGREPTAEQQRRWPDAKRVIYAWDVVEASLVTRGACGPTCRTLEAKSCGCGIAAPALPDPAAVERLLERANLLVIASEHAERQHDFAMRDCAHLVPEDTQREAKRLVAFGCKRFGLHVVPRVAWRDLPGAWGQWHPHRPFEIALHHEVRAARLPQTIGHELDHYAASVYGRPQSEAAADAAARALASAWHEDNPDEALTRA